MMTHRNDNEWLLTKEGEKRGWIQPLRLAELWIHTGTACNLRCPFCFEGASPGDARIEQMTIAEAVRLVDQAREIGVKQVSFTGGEPFCNKDLIAMLDHALNRLPVLVLTNGTTPLLQRLDEIRPLKSRNFPLKFRISLDYPDSERHEANRGIGNFAKALRAMRLLAQAGFPVRAARFRNDGENTAEVERRYREMFIDNGIPEETGVVSFPFLPLPGASSNATEITEDCIRKHCDKSKIETFMCCYSKMAVKRNGRIAILPCTLVDDDDLYDLGSDLAQTMHYKIMLRHPRCLSCFSEGVKCDE